MTAELVTLDDFGALPSSLPLEELIQSGSRLRLRALADVQARQVKWLLPGFIPLRTLTLIAGVGGLGKSTWLAAVAAQVSRGECLGGAPADVLIVSYEDPAAEVLRPRVEAAGGDLARVHQVVVDRAEEIDPVRLPHDVGDLERVVKQVGARLLIVDPIVAAIDTALDAHKDQHVRAVLARLADLAESVDAAVALVGHLNKAPSSDPYLRIGGSTAFWNASRSVVIVTEDPEEPESLRFVAQRKANWSRVSPVQRHRIEEIVLPDSYDAETGERIVTSRMVFVEDASDVDGAHVLAPRVAGSGGGSADGEKSARAALFLAQMLADGDWHDSAGLKPLAGAQGIKERTLQRTAKDLGVEHERRGFPSSTHWRLPQQSESRQGFSHTNGGTSLNGVTPHGYAKSLPFDGVVAPAPLGEDAAGVSDATGIATREWEGE